MFSHCFLVVLSAAKDLIAGTTSIPLAIAMRSFASLRTTRGRLDSIAYVFSLVARSYESTVRMVLKTSWNIPLVSRPVFVL
jgi:hypothetical protein